MKLDLVPVFQDPRGAKAYLVNNFRRIADLFAQMPTQSALPDTSGATLAQLETEVNELKARLRAFGVMSP